MRLAHDNSHDNNGAGEGAKPPAADSRPSYNDAFAALHNAFASPDDVFGLTSDPALLAEAERNRGLATVAALMTAEIFGTAGHEQARGFSARWGRGWPRSTRSRRCVTCAMQGAVNAVWRPLGLGEAEITLDLQGVLIHHHDVPVMALTHMGGGVGHGAETCWAEAAPAMLTGAYDAWLRTMGSPDTLITRVMALNGNTVELRHGVASLIGPADA